MDGPAADGAADLKPRLRKGVRLHFDKVRSSWFILAPERAIQLDTPSAETLSRVDGETTVAAIAKSLAGSFDAPEDDILRDIVPYLMELREKRYIDFDG